jgi:hypothetical protein
MSGRAAVGLVLVLVAGSAAAACRRDEGPASAAATAPAGAKPGATGATGATAATGATVPPAKRAPPAPASLTRVTIKALGMYCEESCPVKVRYALADVPSVYELGFDLSTESIFVSYDAALGPAKQVTKPMIVAIKGAGFDPWLSKESWPEGAKAQIVLR